MGVRGSSHVLPKALYTSKHFFFLNFFGEIFLARYPSDLAGWSFEDMSRLRKDKSSKECAKEVGCGWSTWKKYYRIKEQPFLKYAPLVFKKPVKLATKSASSNLFLDPEEMRVATFDIETSGLRADAAIMFCATAHTYGTPEDPKLFKIDIEEKDLLYAESYLVEEVCLYLSEFDGLIGYYSSRFDLPFLRVRSFLHGTQNIPKIKMLDLYFTVKRVCRPMASKRLARVNDLLRYKKPELQTKTDVDMFRWIACVMSRDASALNEICEHNIADVQVLEEAVVEFAPYVPDKILRT
jgi:uncharacterized protein YprB with RNaseH-like and TPR domain